ncbi:MAG: hypothetical protein K2M46_00245 [Lachnospiraceae bacterium]|nr:hypothetical protein [Lachnospiraceae bacterium]
MIKMTEKAMRNINGGAAHYAYCVACYKVFSCGRFGSLKKVKEAAIAHCNKNGGPSKGHRYVLLY